MFKVLTGLALFLMIAFLASIDAASFIAFLWERIIWILFYGTIGALFAMAYQACCDAVRSSNED